MWLSFLIASAHASCERIIPPAEVVERLDAAAVSLGEGELERFEDDLALVELGVQCLAEPVETGLAARLHRFWGIRAFAGGEQQVATSHFHTARSLAPDEGLPVYPQGHPIQNAFQASVESLPLDIQGPDRSPLFVDGAEAVTLDSAGAHLLQYRLADAQTLAYYQLPAGARPPWMAPPREKASSVRPILFGLGAASLVAAVGCGVGNVLAGQSFLKGTSRAELKSRQRTTNGLAVATGVTGALGVGLVVGGVLAPKGGR